MVLLLDVHGFGLMICILYEWHVHCGPCTYHIFMMLCYVWLCYVMKLRYDMNVIWCMYFQMLHHVYYVNMFTSCLWDIDKSCVLTIKDMHSIYIMSHRDAISWKKKERYEWRLSMYHDLKLWNLMHFVCHVHHDTSFILISSPWYYTCSFPSVASNSVNIS